MATVVEVLVGLLLAVAASGFALARLAEIREAEPPKQDALDRLRVEYEDRVRQLEVCAPGDCDEPHRLFSAEYEQLPQEALRVERRTILRLRNERVINDHVSRRIQRDIDLAEAQIGGSVIALCRTQ